MAQRWKLLEAERPFLSAVRDRASYEPAEPPAEGMVVREAATGPFGIVDFSKYFEPGGPLIQHGSAKGATAATWYKVTFPKRFATAPTVSATAFYRPGTQPKKVYTAPSWTAPTFNPPTFSAPNFSLPANLIAPGFSIALPSWEMPDYKQDLRNQLAEVYKIFMARFARLTHDALDHDPIKSMANYAMKFIYGPEDGHLPEYNPPYTYPEQGSPWSLSVYGITYAIWRMFADILADKMYDIVSRVVPTDIDRFRTKVQEAITTAFSSWRDKVNTQFSSYNTNVQSSVQTFRDNLQSQMDAYNLQLREQMNAFSNSLQSAVNQTAKLAENSINNAVNILYEHVGLPQTATITVVQLRNVTQDGFEFLSQGNTEIHWIALAD